MVWHELPNTKCPEDKRNDCGLHELADLHIDSQQIEQVQQYKYLGVTVNNKLTWSDHCQGLYKRINQRLFCLWNLLHFNIENNIMKIITYAITSWYGNKKK